jgi:hypothetical protein
VTAARALPSEDAIVVVSNRQVACDVGGEAVVLQMDQGVYYGLNAVGARVWQLIQTPVSVSAVIDQIEREFDVERARCAVDVCELVADLARAQLVSIAEVAPA